MSIGQKFLNVQLPNIIKSRRTSIGTVVEWAKDGRRMITYPPTHRYFYKHGINQVEIYINGTDKTVSFLRNGKPVMQGYLQYSPREKAINPNSNGMVGNLGEVINSLA